MKQKLSSMMGVLVMLIGITLVTVGCDQANKAGGNGDNTGNNSANGITGVWKITKFNEQTFPKPMTEDGVPAGAQEQPYFWLTTDGKIIHVAEITGFPGNNGFHKVPQEGTYKLLPENKVEVDLGLGGGSGAYTVSYTISGNTLTLKEMEIEAVKVTSPTGAQIKALP